VKFGLILPIQSQHESLDVLIDEIIEEAVAAEAAGFDACFLPEFHQAHGGAIVSPHLIGAAILRATTTLRFGAAVLAAPLHHPVRLAEELIMLDWMSKGRIIAGLGIGHQVPDFRAYGVDRDARGASASIHRDMQRGAAGMLTRADVIVRCTAPRAEPIALASDGEVLGEMIDVSTMSDLGGASGGLRVSARTGEGVEQLRQEIAGRIRSDRALRRAQLAAVLPRQDRAFAQAERALRDVAALAAPQQADCTARRRLTDVELVASLLRAALDSLGEVAGPVHPDDVLGLVFSRFCIGK